MDKPGVAPGLSVCKTEIFPRRQAHDSCGTQGLHLPPPACRTGAVPRLPVPREERRRAERESNPRAPGCSRRSSPENRLMVRAEGIAPSSSVWKTEVLLLNDARVAGPGERPSEGRAGNRTPSSRFGAVMVTMTPRPAWRPVRESNSPHPVDSGTATPVAQQGMG